MGSESGDDDDDDDECPICLEAMTPTASVRLGCTHKFHRRCIGTIHLIDDVARCPECRSAIEEADIVGMIRANAPAPAPAHGPVELTQLVDSIVRVLRVDGVSVGPHVCRCSADAVELRSRLTPIVAQLCDSPAQLSIDVVNNPMTNAPVDISMGVAFAPDLPEAAGLPPPPTNYTAADVAATFSLRFNTTYMVMEPGDVPRAAQPFAVGLHFPRPPSTARYIRALHTQALTTQIQSIIREVVCTTRADDAARTVQNIIAEYIPTIQLLRVPQFVHLATMVQLYRAAYHVARWHTLGQIKASYEECVALSHADGGTPAVVGAFVYHVSLLAAAGRVVNMINAARMLILHLQMDELGEWLHSTD